MFVQVYSEAECTLRGIQPSMILLVEMNSGYSLTAKRTFNLVDVVGVVDFQRYNGTNAKKEEEKYAMSGFFCFFKKGGTNSSFCRKHFPYKLLKMRASSCTDLPDKCSKMNTVPA